MLVVDRTGKGSHWFAMEQLHSLKSAQSSNISKKEVFAKQMIILDFQTNNDL